MSLAISGSWFDRDARQSVNAALPRTVLNWKEARYYARHGEMELHFLDLLCERDRDSIDVGANDGCYVLFLRKFSRHVYAFEPLPDLAEALTKKFTERDVTIRRLGLSDHVGTATLRTPVVDGRAVVGCSTISDEAVNAYGGFREIQVQLDTLDHVYGGDAGFIKIDVEGYEDAVFAGAAKTIGRCQPTVLVEIIDWLAPGGLARALEFFGQWNYACYFLFGRQFLPVSRFDPATMQNRNASPDLNATLEQRPRFGGFASNFIFIPEDKAEATANRVRERIARM